MTQEEREESLPPMVLRQSKVGGNSIKTTDHPAYQQALEQYPEESGARSSTDQAPRRYPVHDRHRYDDQDWQDDEAWKDKNNCQDTNPKQDADRRDRWYDRRYR